MSRHNGGRPRRRKKPESERRIGLLGSASMPSAQPPPGFSLQLSRRTPPRGQLGRGFPPARLFGSPAFSACASRHNARPRFHEAPANFYREAFPARGKLPSPARPPPCKCAAIGGARRAGAFPEPPEPPKSSAAAFCFCRARAISRRARSSFCPTCRGPRDCGKGVLPRFRRIFVRERWGRVWFGFWVVGWRWAVAAAGEWAEKWGSVFLRRLFYVADVFGRFAGR